MGRGPTFMRRVTVSVAGSNQTSSPSSPSVFSIVRKRRSPAAVAHEPVRLRPDLDPLDDPVRRRVDDVEVVARRVGDVQLLHRAGARGHQRGGEEGGGGGVHGTVLQMACGGGRVGPECNTPGPPRRILCPRRWGSTPSGKSDGDWNRSSESGRKPVPPPGPVWHTCGTCQVPSARPRTAVSHPAPPRLPARPTPLSAAPAGPAAGRPDPGRVPAVVPPDRAGRPGRADPGRHAAGAGR